MNIAAINEQSLKIVTVYADEKFANKDAAQSLHLAGEAADFNTFSDNQVVKLFNKNRLPGMEKVKQFTSKPAGIVRILAIIKDYPKVKGAPTSTTPQEQEAEQTATNAEKGDAVKKKAGKKKVSKKVAKKVGKKKVAKKKAASSSSTRAARIKDEDSIKLLDDGDKSWMNFDEVTAARKLPKGPSRRQQCHALLTNGMTVAAYVKKADKKGIDRSQALACLGKMAEVDQKTQTVSIVRS